MIFNFFKKNQSQNEVTKSTFEIELTAGVLAYEIARSDGEITESELSVLMEEIQKIAKKVGKEKKEILQIIQAYSKDSISFHEFIEDINTYYTKEDKLNLLEYMWKMAYADGRLDVDEEKLVRRTADLIRIKDLDVLKLKSFFKK